MNINAQQVILNAYISNNSNSIVVKKFVCKILTTSYPGSFTYARRSGKDPGWSWSRDSLKNPLLYRVGKAYFLIFNFTGP